jgi:hypothetical protein
MNRPRGIPSITAQNIKNTHYSLKKEIHGVWKITCLSLVIFLVLAACSSPAGGDGTGGDIAVSDFSLDGKVTAPVQDAAPVTTPIDAAQYTGIISWQTVGGC